MLMGSGGYQGGRNPGFQTELLSISRSDWSDLHALAGLVVIVGVPEHLAHLFERFWRGAPSRSRRTGSSGLGLTIAQRIVKAHGGRMWAENTPTGGLRIGFSLPGE
jgi:light-regulated signal transduction histidine kinase (bacteriophytochrome)